MQLTKNKRKLFLATLVVGILILTTFLFSGAILAQTLDEGLEEIQEITDYSSQDLIVTIGRIIQVVLRVLLGRRPVCEGQAADCVGLSGRLPCFSSLAWFVSAKYRIRRDE